MALLTALVDVLDSDGVSVVPLNADGTRPLVKIQLAEGITATPRTSGDTCILDLATAGLGTPLATPDTLVSRNGSADTAIHDVSVHAVKLSGAVTETRVLAGGAMFDPAVWALDVAGGIGALVALAASPSPILFEPDASELPNGSTTVSISVRIIGAGGHAAFPGGAPAVMPSVIFAAVDTTTDTAGVIGTVTDTSASAAAFQAAHTLVLAADTTIDRSRYRYLVAVAGESGAGSIVGDAVRWVAADRTRGAGTKLGQD